MIARCLLPFALRLVLAVERVFRCNEGTQYFGHRYQYSGWRYQVSGTWDGIVSLPTSLVVHSHLAEWATYPTIPASNGCLKTQWIWLELDCAY